MATADPQVQRIHELAAAFGVSGVDLGVIADAIAEDVVGDILPTDKFAIIGILAVTCEMDGVRGDIRTGTDLAPDIEAEMTARIQANHASVSPDMLIDRVAASIRRALAGQKP